MILEPYLQLMVEKKASDLYISADALPQLRIDGKTLPVGRQIMTAQIVSEAAFELMNERERQHFERYWEANFTYPAPQLGRFRVNVFRQRGHAAMVIRHVQPATPRIRELGLPPILQDLAIKRQGLVLVVGPTGCGKSTTLAAMVEHRNEHFSGHILTIEDPVEFFIEGKRSIVNQRELGVDTKSYQAALASALRSAPDVVMIGEVRDRQTMSAVLELAGTGHLCVASMHANSAPHALERIVNLFPAEQYKQLFLDLSLYLQAVVSQRLVLSTQGPRIPAVEVMLSTPFIAELIARGQFDKLKSAMEDSRVQGMQDMDTVLHRLYSTGIIALDEALAHADSRANLEAKIHFAI
jgi:twitching motility protein PilU